jgi:hypothetical protein
VCVHVYVRIWQSDIFQAPIPAELVPDYYDRVFHPFDLSIMERRAKTDTYRYVCTCTLSRSQLCNRCTAQFLHDAEWLVHNAYTFYGGKHKITDDARTILQICRGEIDQIELCPDCYRVSIDRGDAWFTQICVRSLFH